MTSTYTRYIVEDADGNEAVFSAFEQAEYQSARDLAESIKGRVIAHEYEWSDSELVDDFTGATCVQGGCDAHGHDDDDS